MNFRFQDHAIKIFYRNPGIPDVEIWSRHHRCMSWEEDPEVIQRIDDLMDSIETPMTDLMRAIWPHHEQAPEWLCLSLVAGFVKNYNHARFVDEIDAESSLRIAASIALSNPSLQQMVGEQLANFRTEAVLNDD